MSDNSDFKLNSRAEQYLQENHGKLNTFYETVAQGYNFLYAFGIALCKPDVYRLRTAGLYNDLTENLLGGIGDIENDKIHLAIDYLEETAAQYPEDHPIWNMR